MRLLGLLWRRKPSPDEIMWKLVTLAGGDTELANDACRKARVGDKIDLREAVAAVVRMKRERAAA